MRRRFYDFNNRFRTTKNTEVIVFDKGGFVGPLGLVENFIKDMLKLIRNFVKINLLLLVIKLIYMDI
nr:MAG: hypothetical protein [Bacteriophage sp.]UVX56503.1 MAG: hypothetical protein [Bacteriophage sp.]